MSGGVKKGSPYTVLVGCKFVQDHGNQCGDFSETMRKSPYGTAAPLLGKRPMTQHPAPQILVSHVHCCCAHNSGEWKQLNVLQ